MLLRVNHQNPTLLQLMLPVMPRDLWPSYHRVHTMLLVPKVLDDQGRHLTAINWVSQHLKQVRDLPDRGNFASIKTGQCRGWGTSGKAQIAVTLYDPDSLLQFPDHHYEGEQVGCEVIVIVPTFADFEWAADHVVRRRFPKGWLATPVITLVQVEGQY